MRAIVFAVLGLFVLSTPAAALGPPPQNIDGLWGTSKFNNISMSGNGFENRCLHEGISLLNMPPSCIEQEYVTTTLPVFGAAARTQILMIRDCEQAVAPELCGDGHRDLDLHVLDWMGADHAVGTWYTTRLDDPNFPQCFPVLPNDNFPLPLTNEELNGVRWKVNGRNLTYTFNNAAEKTITVNIATSEQIGTCNHCEGMGKICEGGSNHLQCCSGPADCPGGTCKDLTFTWKRHTQVEGTVTDADAIRNGLFGVTGPLTFNAFVVADVVVNGAVGDWAVEFLQSVPEGPCTGCLYRWLHAPLNGFFVKRRSNSKFGAETRDPMCDFINGTFNLNLGYKCSGVPVQYTNTGMECSKSRQPCTLDLDCAPIDTNGDCISTKLCLGGCYTR